MHIPDGFLSPTTAVATAAIALGALTLALRKVNRDLPPRQVPLIGLVAAFVFAAQMLNFPVAAGTSGHLIGAVLATVLVGPAAAIVAMSAVLILQCLMFADGGVTALGANLLNMAVIAPLTGHLVYRATRHSAPGLRGVLLGAGFAAWCATVVASVACAVQLAVSGTAPAALVVPAMGGIHMLIGLGEAVITMLVVAVVARARPELVSATRAVDSSAEASPRVRTALAGALVLAIVLAPFASQAPDGLERVAEHLGFAAQAVEAGGAPLPAYNVPALADLPLASTAIAGAVGTAVAFLLAWFLARSLTSGSRRP